MNNIQIVFIILAIAIIVGMFMFLKPKNTPTLTGPIKEFTINGSSFKYDPDTITVNKGDIVKIIFKDTDGRHNLLIDSYGITSKVLSSGKEESLEFIADKTGSFKMYCSLPGHEDNGMVGKLIVN